MAYSFRGFESCLHSSTTHPGAVDGEGCKVVAKERHRAVQHRILQNASQVRPGVYDANEGVLQASRTQSNPRAKPRTRQENLVRIGLRDRPT